MGRANQLLCAALGLAVVFDKGDAKNVTWSNVAPRHNVTGDVMDAHDGPYRQWGGPGTPWFYYAMGYGTCKQGQDMCHGCGYGYSWLGVWTSNDLSDGSWRLLGEARADDGTWPTQAQVQAYFRPHVLFNEFTSKYVLWVNVDDCPDPSAKGACYLVGTSSTPEGPFAYVGTSTARFPSAGDNDLFVDDDVNKTGYLIYTSTTTGHVMSVEQLAPDYTQTLYNANKSLIPPGTDPTNISSGVFGNHFVEAPAMFKRNGIYYALFGECCCFCGHGSGIGVYTASAPLGPWMYHENIGCAKDGANFEPKEGCGCGMNGGSPRSLQCPSEYGSSVTKAQQNFVIQAHGPSGIQYIWTGDMWQSASDGIKAHDLQFWTPLEFAVSDASGIPLPRLVQWIDNFTIDIL